MIRIGFNLLKSTTITNTTVELQKFLDRWVNLKVWHSERPTIETTQEHLFALESIRSVGQLAGDMKKYESES